jgi:DNA-binding HxlR family transcriptional regulator
MAGETHTYRSGCPLASALDILGDRWSLLIVRGLFTGCVRFGDFMQGPERIATNILASRLQQLQAAGILERLKEGTGRSAYRYRLTRAGAELLPTLQALARWGWENLEDRWEPPEWFMSGIPSDFYPPEP